MGHKPINSACIQLKGQKFISRYFQANHSFSECSNDLLLILLSLGEDSRLLQSPEVPLQTLQAMLGSQRMCRQSYVKHHVLALIHVIFFWNDTFGHPKIMWIWTPNNKEINIHSSCLRFCIPVYVWTLLIPTVSRCHPADRHEACAEFAETGCLWWGECLFKENERKQIKIQFWNSSLFMEQKKDRE